MRTLECFSSLLGYDCQPMQWTYWVIRLILYPPNSHSIGFHGKYVQTHRTKSTWESVEGSEEKREWTFYFYLQIKAKYIYVKYDPLKLANISYLNSSSVQLISCCNEHFKTKICPSCIRPPVIREETAFFTECFAAHSENVAITHSMSIERVFHKRNILTSIGHGGFTHWPSIDISSELVKPARLTMVLMGKIKKTKHWREVAI